MDSIKLKLYYMDLISIRVNSMFQTHGISIQITSSMVVTNTISTLGRNQKSYFSIPGRRYGGKKTPFLLSWPLYIQLRHSLNFPLRQFPEASIFLWNPPIHYLLVAFTSTVNLLHNVDPSNLCRSLKFLANFIAGFFWVVKSLSMDSIYTIHSLLNFLIT